MTGGGGGIGRAVALAFAREGASVVAADIDIESARRTASSGDIEAQSCVAWEVDVANATSVERMTDSVLARFGRLDILINCAGVASPAPGCAAIDLTGADWDRMLSTNLTGAFLCAQGAAKAMIARGEGGAIVNVASVAASRPKYDFAAYGASKAGMVHLTMSLAVGLGQYGIRVNAVQPGTVVTSVTERTLADPQVKAARIKLHPLGRLGSPDDVAGAVLFLSSDDARWITGVSLPVDGGRMLIN